jgi:hypothetical protein
MAARGADGWLSRWRGCLSWWVVLLVEVGGLVDGEGWLSWMRWEVKLVKIGDYAGGDGWLIGGDGWLIGGDVLLIVGDEWLT